MMKINKYKCYTFSNIEGREVTVSAVNEKHARHLAMKALWGWPNKTWICDRYSGLGLIMK